LKLYYPNDINQIFVTFNLAPIIYFFDSSKNMRINSAIISFVLAK